MPQPLPPMSTHDARVVTFRLEKALIELEEEAELDILEGMLKDQSWSNNVQEGSQSGGVEPKAKQTEKIPFHDLWVVQ